MSEEQVVRGGVPAGAAVDRARLEALRYAVNDEAEVYIAIMRLFTGGISGLLSDQSAAEVTEALRELGHDVHRLRSSCKSIRRIAGEAP